MTSATRNEMSMLSSAARIETVVRGVRIEAEEIRSFELVARHDQKLPDWSPGAHVQVFLPGNLSRSYSLCNHAGETDCYRIAVKLENASRGGSRAMHGLQAGDRLQISAPRNLFGLDKAARFHVLIAGGIGVTPLYAMFNALHQQRACEMHYFARSVGHAAFSERLRLGMTLHAGLDLENTRVALHRIVTAHAHRPDTSFYTCGPAAFMQAVEDAALEAGIPAARLHSERFGADLPPAQCTPATGGFRIVFARSGIEANVPADASIIQVARRHGVDIPTSCEQGVCGACLTDVIDGTPLHHDAYLSAAEQAGGRLILPCVSRCQGAGLVIDR